MSDCAHCRELLGGYVLGALDDADHAAVGIHLQGCPRCRREHAELAGVPALLDLVESPDAAFESPPPGLEESVLDRFARERSSTAPPDPPRRSRWGLRVGAAGAAAAVALALVLVLAGAFSSSPDDSAFGHVRMSGARGAAAHADLRALDEGTGVRLSATGLRPGPHPIYELWCVTDDGHWISGGTFRADRHGRARAALTSAARPGDYEVMLITRRPDRRRVMTGRVEY